MSAEEPSKATTAEGIEDAAPAVVVAGRRNRDAETTADDGAGRRGLYIAMGLVMIGGAIVALVLGGLQDNGIYSKSVDELLASSGKLTGKAVRAEGNLVHGSLVKRDSPCEYRFTVEKKGVQMPVRYAQCVVPDTFRDVPNVEVGVTVEGKLQPDGSFEASSVLAKCPSKYDMKDKAARGEQMPHEALPNL